MTYVTSRRQRPIESYDVLSTVRASKETRNAPRNTAYALW